ncbi:DUF4974 domain-containing protein [Puteibacter caeruleilacunae]|nr:DUF4974 domain-containing protein [Puteibacter caeruleilacunae]
MCLNNRNRKKMIENTPWEHIIESIKEDKKSDILQQWLDQSEEHRKQYAEMVEVWQLTGSIPKRFKPNATAAWANIEKRTAPGNKRFTLNHWVSRAAVALILIASSIWLGTLINSPADEFAVVVAPKGQKTKIFLPDSSVVMLNGGSKLKYATDFNRDHRDVYLTGEGFFRVRKHSKKMFIVHTHALDVKVFGTVFNVKAYQGEPKVEVGLKSGSVRLDREGKQVTMLKPGELASYNRESHSMMIEKKNIDLICAWTHHQLVFDNNSFSEVVTMLERWYGVSIQLDDQLVGEHKFTFKVKTESLNELLEMMSVMAPISYSIDGKDIKITTMNN